MHTVRIGISFDSHSIYAWHLFTSRIFARYSKVLIVASVSRSSWRLPVDTTLQTSQNNLPQALERMPSRSYVCFAKGKAMIVHICSRMNLLVKFPSWVPRCRACMRVPCFIIPAVPIRRFFKTGVGVCMIFHVFPFTVGSIKQVGPVSSLLHPKCALVVRMLGKQGVKWWPWTDRKVAWRRLDFRLLDVLDVGLRGWRVLATFAFSRLFSSAEKIDKGLAEKTVKHQRKGETDQSGPWHRWHAFGCIAFWGGCV